MKIELLQPFAANSKADEFDVKKMKKALNRLGYYQPFEGVGITGIADKEVFDALKAFQKDYGLTVTGSAKPNDATVQTLNKQASKTPEGQYIWRTVEDEKVRTVHAELNRTVRDWNDDPDPGEEFNCRCWAEPVSSKIRNNCEKEEKAWVNAGAKFFIAKQNLDRANNEKRQFEIQKSESESALIQIDKEIEKEKKEKRDAQNKGAAAGAAAGALIGAPTGPGGSMGVAGIGIGVGAKGGRFIEEIIDVISDKSESDLSLSIKKQRLLKNIKDAEKKIEKIETAINTVLMPDFQKAKGEEEIAKAALRTCKIKHKE